MDDISTNDRSLQDYIQIYEEYSSLQYFQSKFIESTNLIDPLDRPIIDENGQDQTIKVA